MATSDNAASAVVHLDGQTYTVSWTRTEMLLDALLDEGIEVLPLPVPAGLKEPLQ